MAQIRDALKITRTLLNDDAALVWHDSVLMPKAVQAHQELLNTVTLNGVPCIWTATTLATIPAFAKNMGANLPLDIIRPIKMDERLVGDVDSNAIPMTKVDFVPNLDITDTLRYWGWIEEQIIFLGANQARQVRLYYDQWIPTPVAVTDNLFFRQSETFLGPRIAALCSIGLPTFDVLNNMADANLSKIIRREVKALQNLPVRKRPFSYAIKARRRFGL